MSKELKIKEKLDDSDSESLFQPEGKPTSKQMPKKSRKNAPSHGAKGKRVRTNGWSLEENIRYKGYLSTHQELFQLPLRQRKEVKINIKMSRFVKTREPSQCRSHHQKMVQYHGSILAIIAHIEDLENALQSQNAIQIIPESNPIQPEVELKEINHSYQEKESLWEALIYPTHASLN